MTMREVIDRHGLRPPYGIECGDGWAELVDGLCAKLFAAGWDGDTHQIKEKFGGLRFYVGAASNECFALIDEAERVSLRTCETCGEPGVSAVDRGWVSTRCSKCRTNEVTQ